MTSVNDDNQTTAIDADARAKAQRIDADAAHNLITLAVHHIVLRVAWIFKTESVLMPAFMDAISGAGWMRGCLPILNRIGQSIPPLYFAERLRTARWKKRPLMITAACMGVPFLILAGLIFAMGVSRGGWLPYLFLILYLAFFSTTGLNALTFGTIQGKLIPAARRGRLLAIAGTFGSVFAITFAWFLLQRWLSDSTYGFGKIFLFAGTGFVASGFICLWIREPPDTVQPPPHPLGHPIADAMRAVRDDIPLRHLAITAMLFITAQLLFPHYQALGRERPGWQPTELMIWVIAQNAGAGLFSLVAGHIADRFGNRLTLRLLILGSAATPLLSLYLANNHPHLFWLTFLALGTVPTSFKIFINYALEITGHENHPRYISAMKLCMAGPLFFAPFVGVLIDRLGFDTMFPAVACLTMTGTLMTFVMIEPRLSEQTESHA